MVHALFNERKVSDPEINTKDSACLSKGTNNKDSVATHANDISGNVFLLPE